MPAVIDTGGPRVLHCVERAVCPAIIPSALAIVVASSCSSSRPAQPTYPVQQEEKSRFTVDRIVHRCNKSIADALHRSSITQTRLIPGNDERDEFFIDERSSTVSATSSNDLGRLVVARSERRHCAKDRKRRYDESRRRRINRKNSSSIDEIHRTEELLVSLAQKKQNVPEFNETVRQCESVSWSNCRVENDQEIGNDRQRTRNHDEKEPDGSTKRSASHLKLVSTEDHWHGGERGQSSDCVMRLFGNFSGVKEEEGSMMYPRVEESSAQSAAISSQRVSNCVEYEWPCECECFSRISNRDELGSTRVKSEMDRTTRERRKTRHRSDILHKGRSYVQLAFLIFLIAFGHGSLFKSKFGNFRVKSTSIGAGGLGVLTIGTIVGSVRAVPLDFDAGVRAERSANISHMTGASRKIMIYIKNRHLQILPDGTVNGSDNDMSDYTIFERKSVSWGSLIIQSVATCLYLCMDSCGLPYGSRESTDDCVFNETLEEHNYNTYSSIKWSTSKKNLYIGLNRHGQPRRVQAKGHDLGRLSTYASALPRAVSQERVEALHKRMLNSHHNLRHKNNSHHHRNIQNQQKKQQQQTICPNLPPLKRNGRDKSRCNMKKKKKKRKRQCKKGEKPGAHCRIFKNPANAGNGRKSSSSTSETDASQSKKSCEAAANEELCKKQTLEEEIKGDKNSDGSSSSGKVSGTNESVKRKRPGLAERMSLMGMRRKINGRIPRITIAAQQRILAMHLPSSWFPGEATTELSVASRRTSKTTLMSATQNSITSPVVPLKATRMAKSLNDEAQFASPASSTLETNMEDILEEHPSGGVSYFTNDSSLETSDETMSDESLQQDYDSTISNIEFSTLMTTMDTTPPERTENYTRATTQSIHP